MRILLVAPQPFYVERGTPIAVRLLAETLCSFGHSVDLLAYHAGADIEVSGLRIIRAKRPPGVQDVPIGISWQKLACDGYLVWLMVRLLRDNAYDVIHAVEESVFPVVWLARRGGRKVVYDMDSWMSEQLTNKWTLLRPLRSLLVGMERRAISRATVVLPVCEDLAEKVRPWVPADRVVMLPDVPAGDAGRGQQVEPLRQVAGDDAAIGLYVGNLERYQGIDLLLDGIARLPAETRFRMVIIGGSDADIARYAKEARARGISERVQLVGRRPLEHLGAYLDQADVLVSPRTLGGNTPMKIYSYMQAGRAILATDIRSHSQVLDSSCALLVPAEPGAIADGITRLAADAQLRDRLGAAARLKAESEYSIAAYRRRLRQAYALLE